METKNNIYDVIIGLLSGEMNRSNSASRVTYLLSIVWNGEYDKAIEHASTENGKLYYDSQFVNRIKFLKDSLLWNQFSLIEKGNYIISCAKEYSFLSNTGYENLKILIREKLFNDFDSFDDNFRGEIKEIIKINDGVFFKILHEKEGVKYFISNNTSIVFHKLEHAILHYFSPTYFSAMIALVNSDEKSPVYDKVIIG